MVELKEMSEKVGYRVGEQPKRYGCRDYSLEMQLLQLKKGISRTSVPVEKRRMEERITEIEVLLGL
ncbi:MAG: hypothetical protein JXR89_12545 [Deltaproteobacteria bacterium]|nr:hypothetical protein [Deltaproteobacteria bacterium]